MKRLIDVIVSFVAILVFLPLMFVIAILVRWRLGSPIFFRQQRPGLHGKPFCILKFRSMLDGHGAGDDNRTDAERLTRFGHLLRATSLDELPELWNVLRGQMSLIGPRPLLMEYLPLYDDFQGRRHEVRPGLTGWAQVNGRNDISWQEKFRLDVWYVDHQGLWLDTKIVLTTIVKILNRDGVAKSGHATTDYFEGNKR